MKIIFKFFLTASVILALNITNACSPQIRTCLAYNRTFYPQTNPITHQQTKAQIELFREALDKFGANSPEQVISI